MIKIFYEHEHEKTFMKDLIEESILCPFRKDCYEGDFRKSCKEIKNDIFIYLVVLYVQQKIYHQQE